MKKYIQVNHPELGVIHMPVDSGKVPNNVQSLTGLELAAIIAGAITLWEVTWGAAALVRARRMSGKDVVVCTKGRRTFSGKVSSVKGIFNPEIVLENDEGEKRTLLYSSIALICEKRSAEFRGAREEAREMLIVGDITKEEHAKLLEGIKIREKATDEEKKTLPEDLKDILKKDESDDKSEEKKETKKTTTRSRKKAA